MCFILRKGSFVIKSCLGIFFTPVMTNLLLLYFRSWRKGAFIVALRRLWERAMCAWDVKTPLRSDIYLWARYTAGLSPVSLHLSKPSGKFPRFSSQSLDRISLFYILFSVSIKMTSQVLFNRHFIHWAISPASWCFRRSAEGGFPLL